MTQDSSNYMMSACGVLCSGCGAYYAQQQGSAYQKRIREAWHMIYGLNETVEHISCCGCLAPDEKVFHTCRTCTARQCCRTKGFQSCAECPVEDCALLEKAQSVWDDVPDLVHKLSSEDFETYVRPYCDHRKRITQARGEIKKQKK